MNCTHHIQKQVSFICIAPHKCECRRKLCEECLLDHGVDVINTVPIDKFREMIINKLKESNLDETSEVTKQRNDFKSILSQIETMMRKIWEELSESIKQIYDMIEKDEKSYLQIVNNNKNPAELSNTDLELLVQIVEGKTLNERNEKHSYMIKLEKTMNWWEEEIQVFSEMLKKKMQKVLEEYKVNQRKEDLFEILANIKDIDESIYKVIMLILRKEKISDIIKFLSRKDNQKHYESIINKQEKLSDVKKTIKIVANVLRNLQDHYFSKQDYFTETDEDSRLVLINKIAENKNIINFLKFLVHLSTIDENFIQCGYNGLKLLVSMKVDVTNQCFENIRIKNPSFIGDKFVRCNLSSSILDNAGVSGVNLNGAQLFNCKLKAIQIHELNKLEGHSESVRSICISPDSTTLASGSLDNSIGLWDVKTGKLKAKLDGHTNYVYSVCFSPDGTKIASSSNDMSIRLWDVKTRKIVAKLVGHSAAVYSVCFFPDGTTLASGSRDYSIRFWDVKTGQQKAKLDVQTSYVCSVCFSPDGITLASGDKSIRLWDVKTRKIVAKLVGHTSYVYSVCFSPDGHTLAAGCGNKSISLWDVKTGQQKAKLEGNSGGILSVCFSPDSTTLASGSFDNSIRLWDVKTGQQREKLNVHSNVVVSVCFSPDGTKLASGSKDKSIRLWDVKTEQSQVILDGHTSSGGFSPDDTTLISSSEDKSLCLWDVKAGKEIETLDKSYKNTSMQQQK